MLPQGFIQDLLSRVDVVEVVGRHVELKKAGINHKGLCPFHGEKSPSFIVSPSRQTYHCFGCGVHGDAIRFLTEHHGMGFMDAVKDLAQQVGLAVPESTASPEDRAKADAERAQRAGESADTPLFKLVVWAGFFLAMGLTGWGLLRMEIHDTYKAFLGVSWLYLITCTFTLAKTLRDRHEADLSELAATE